MVALPKHQMTVEEFLDWAERQPKAAGRFELHDGHIYMQQSQERNDHSETKAAAFMALHRAINDAKLPCRVLVDGPSVRVGPKRTHKPDGVIYCGPRLPPNERIVPNPVVVIEVLSPSTAKLDHGMKVENYFTITSVQHYLIADPDRRVIIHHRRGQDGTVTIEMRRDGMLRLDPPGLDVQVHDMLAEPYAKDAAN